jgi:RNA polymerase-binding transcription factor DksA
MKTQHFRKQLEEEKIELESQLKTMGRRNPGVPDDWEQAPTEDAGASDLIDHADALTNRENDRAVLDALEARYDTVIAALARIEAGKYGSCEVCSEPVSEERLEANPSATTCALHMR